MERMNPRDSFHLTQSKINLADLGFQCPMGNCSSLSTSIICLSLTNRCLILTWCVKMGWQLLFGKFIFFVSYTPPITEILCVKNGRAIVVCGFLKPISIQVWLDWLCYLAGNSQTAPKIFFKLSAYFFKIISLRTHKPQSPSHFWHIIFQL